MDRETITVGLVVFFLLGLLALGTYQVLSILLSMHKHAKRVSQLRSKNIPVVGKSYFYDGGQLEFVVSGFDPKTGFVEGDVVIHIDEGSELLGAPNDEYLDSVSVPVRHPDGSTQTLKFSLIGREIEMLEGWVVDVGEVKAVIG